MRKGPSFSVIIPTFNEEKYLPNLLRCLQRQTLKPSEIIVSDAASKDQTVSIAKKFGTRTVRGGIPSVGRNAGAEIAKNDVLVFIDADITFSNNFLEKLFDEFTSNQSDLATCIQNTQDLSWSQKLIYNFVNFLSYSSTYLPFKYGSTQVLICSQAVFKEIKGFNEEIEVAEDIDFIRRACKAGFKYSILKAAKNPSDFLSSLFTFRLPGQTEN